MASDRRTSELPADDPGDREDVRAPRIGQALLELGREAGSIDDEQEHVERQPDHGDRHVDHAEQGRDNAGQHREEIHAAERCAEAGGIVGQLADSAPD